MLLVIRGYALIIRIHHRLLNVDFSKQFLSTAIIEPQGKIYQKEFSYGGKKQWGV